MRRALLLTHLQSSLLCRAAEVTIGFPLDQGRLRAMTVKLTQGRVCDLETEVPTSWYHFQGRDSSAEITEAPNRGDGSFDHMWRPLVYAGREVKQHAQTTDYLGKLGCVNAVCE